MRKEKTHEYIKDVSTPFIHFEGLYPPPQTDPSSVLGIFVSKVALLRPMIAKILKISCLKRTFPHIF